METKQYPDLKPGIRTIQEIFKGVKSNPKNCRSVIYKLEDLTDEGKLKMLKDHPNWIVHIFNNGAVSKEELLYYELAKQTKSNQTIKKGVWIVEDVTINQSGGYCIAYSGAVVNQSGGDCIAHSGAVAHQSGGYCIAYPDVVVNQSGGYCYAYLGSVVNQSGNGGTINRT